MANYYSLTDEQITTGIKLCKEKVFDLLDELSDYVLRMVTLPLLGTLFIALRRNLERRFRH